MNCIWCARARVILKRGGAANANVFTRLLLAMYPANTMAGVPVVPSELVLLPRWFPFHLSKDSYWSRTVMVPLSILCTLKAKPQIHVESMFANYLPFRLKKKTIIFPKPIRV